MTISIYFFRR
ncbi:hypothetical protein YPPY66_0973, partial [Yersinia pestis PY-66]